MISLEKILTVAIKDMRGWFRNPFLMLIAIAPLLVISLLMGFFISEAESVTEAVILEDNDPLALEIKNYITTMESGTGLKWFNVQDAPPDQIHEMFKKGHVLSYILVPANLTSRLQKGEVVSLQVYINNVQGDVTKNVLQRVQNVCNHFSNELNYGQMTYYVPTVKFETMVVPDVTFTHYLAAAICALTILLSSGANVATLAAREFEEKTIKELVMGSFPAEIVSGMILAGVIQTLICYAVISVVLFLAFRFVPVGPPLLLGLLIVWGAVTFSSLGFLAAARLKQVIPAALSVIVLNVAGWWIGGGLVPAEVWRGIIGWIGKFWPGTYFFRSFTNLILWGYYNPSVLLFDLLITGILGVVTYVLAIRLFIREVRKC